MTTYFTACNTPYWDQDWFNFAIRKLGLPVFDLPVVFNCMWPREGDAVKEAFIAHFADANKSGAAKLVYAREVLSLWATP